MTTVPRQVCSCNNIGKNWRHLVAQLGDNCTSDYDCVLYLNGTALCSNTDNKCVCAPGYQQRDDFCVTGTTAEPTTTAELTTAVEATTAEPEVTSEELATTVTTETTSFRSTVGGASTASTLPSQPTTAETTTTGRGEATTTSDQLSIVDLKSDEPKPVNETVTMWLTIGYKDSVECILWNFSDYTKQLLLGPEPCVSDAALVDVRQIPAGDVITVAHAFASAGTYDVQVRIWNTLTVDLRTLRVAITDDDGCSSLEIRMDPAGDTELEAVPMKLYKPYTLTAGVNVACRTPRPLKASWLIQNEATGEVVLSAEEAALKLELPGRTLTPGLHKVSVEVHPDGLDELSERTHGYILAENSPIVAVISGGSQRSVSRGSILLLDASQSYDPDTEDSGSDVFEYKWSCWVLGENATDDWCQDDAPGSLETIRVDTTDWQEEQTYVIQLEASANGKTSRTTQTVNIVGADSMNIAVLCLYNCHELVSSDRPVKLQAVCTNCKDDKPTNYSWSLFKRNANEDTYEDITNLETWTTTGTNGQYLSTKEGVLTSGSFYRIQANSGDGYAAFDFRISTPPAGGVCESVPYTGNAWETKFTFICRDFKNEDEHQDVAAIFEYDFRYLEVGTKGIPTPLCAYRGRDVTIKPVLLPSGIQEFDYDIEIHVRITNDAGATAESLFIVKVMPTTLLPSDIISGERMKYFEMIQDFRSMLNFAHSADALISEQEQVYYSQENYEELVDQYDELLSARETLLKMISENTDLLYDSADCLLTAQTMKSFTVRPETLSDQAKNDIANVLFAAITVSMKEEKQDEPEPENKTIIATDILASITSIQNTSRIAPRCPDPEPVTADVSPEEREILEAKAQLIAESQCAQLRKEARALATTLYKTLDLLKTFVLRDMVPGEEPFTFQTAEISYRMEMMSSSELSDVRLSIGDGSFYLPEAFGVHLTENRHQEKSKLAWNTRHMNPVGVGAVFSKKNDYAFSDSAPANQPTVIGISFVGQSGVEYEVNRLERPIKIYQPLHNVKTELKNATTGELKITQFTVLKGPLFIEIQPLAGGLSCALYVSFHKEPSEMGYDWTEEVNFGNSHSVKRTINSPNETTAYLGYQWKSPSNDTELIEFNLTIWQPKCVYYDNDSGTWDDSGCTVSEESTPSETVCVASHLTLFSSDWIVPPNTIDFSTVFDDGAERLVENIHVFMTIILIIIIYVILVIVLRRMDKKDTIKWGVAPLSDNTAEDVYHYQMTVHTGVRKGAGTESTVYFMLGGELADTEVRKLEDTLKRPLSRGSVNNYLLSVPEPLGSLMYIRVWHDNSGKGSKASWYLDKIVIRDIQTNEVYAFLADRWLAVDKDDGNLECLFPAASKEDLVKFQYLFSSTTRQDLTDGHLWFSLVSRPTRSTFTRVQRLSCCLALLFSTMIANAMWYKAEENAQNVQVVHLGLLTFTPQQLFISLASSLVSVPISLIIVTLFRKARPRLRSRKTRLGYAPDDPQKAADVLPDASRKLAKAKHNKSGYLGEELDKMFGMLSSADLAGDPQTRPRSSSVSHDKVTSKKRWRVLALPWWCTYIAWMLVFLTVVVSGVFTILYSFQWGREKSSKWLTAFLLSFIQSVFFIQPLKVIGLAVFIALIVKKPKQEVCPDEAGSIDGEFIDSESKGIDILHRIKRPAHRKPYAMKALDESRLKKMRDDRAKEVKMWAIFREIISYSFYIMVISALTYDAKDPNSYRSKEELSKLFVQGKLEKVKTFSDFWRWSNHTLIPGLYADQLYNGEEAHWTLHYFTDDLTYFRIGSPRLRLQRVKKNSCKIQKKMRRVITYCYDSYGITDMEDDDYGEGWQPISDNNSSESDDLDQKTPWQYQNTLELDGVPVWGNIGTYSGGGYVAELGTKSSEAWGMIQYLLDHQWLDRSSRAVFVEFNLFNPNTNLFSIVNVGLEFPASGGVVPFPVIQTLRLYNYVGSKAVFRLFLDIAFVVFTLYFFVVEVKRMKQQKRDYFKSFWNLLELFNLVGSVLACAMYGVHYVFTRHTIAKFQRDKERYTNFQYVLNWDDLLGYVLAFLVFISMIKLLKLLRFNKKVAELMSALDLASEPLLGFFLFFAILYMAFGHFCYVVFGRLLREYSTFISSLESLFSMMLMNFDYHHLASANRILGPVFFVVYVVLLAFVVINVLVSILNENFTIVKTRNLLTNDDYEMVEYIMNSFKKLFAMNSWSHSLLTDVSTGKKGVPEHAETKLDLSRDTLLDGDSCEDLHRTLSPRSPSDSREPIERY